MADEAERWAIRNLDGGPLVVSQLGDDRGRLAVGESVEVQRTFTDEVIRATAERIALHSLDQTHRYGVAPAGVSVGTWHAECLIRHALEELESTQRATMEVPDDD